MTSHMKSEFASGEGESDELGGAALDGSLHVQALRLRKQEVQEAVRLQQRAVTAFSETVHRMENQVQERIETIRAVRQQLDVRLRGVEGRISAIEDQLRQFRWREESEEGAREGSTELLKIKVVKLETSSQSALGTAFPRVDALVAELEESSPLRAPAASTASSPCPDAGSSRARPPTASALAATAAAAEAPAGAEEEPSAGCQRARALEEKRERQRAVVRLRRASARIDRALAARGLV